MLSKLSSLSIASLRKLDEEANKFSDSKHDLYHTALLLCVNGSGSITSVGEERANLSAVVYL